MSKPQTGERRFMAYTAPNDAGEIASWHIFDGKRWLLCDGEDGRPSMPGVKGSLADATALLRKRTLPDGMKWPNPDRLLP